MSDDYPYDGDDFEGESVATEEQQPATTDWNYSSEPQQPLQPAAYEESLAADPELPAPTATHAPPMKSPQPSRIPVAKHSSSNIPDAAPVSPRAAAPPTAATQPISPNHPNTSLDSPRRQALLAQNPTLARLNKNLDTLRYKSAMISAEHDERILARGGTLNDPTTQNTLSPSSSDAALTSAYALEISDRLKRELNSTKSKLSSALKQIDELKRLREEDALRMKKASRTDQTKLTAQQLANALKKIEIYKKANEVLRNQINSSLNPDKYSSLLNKISEQESYAAALAEENKTLKAEMRRLSKEFEQANEQAGDAPSKIAAHLEEIKHLRDKIKNYHLAKEASEKRARKQQEQVVATEEKYRRAQQQTIELEKKLREAQHQAHALATERSLISHETSTGLAASTVDDHGHLLPSPPATSPASLTDSHSPRPPHSSTSIKPKPKKAPRVAGAPPISPITTKEELDQREKVAEERTAQGVASARANIPSAGASKKKHQPAQLGKITDPITPTPPTQPKPATGSTNKQHVIGGSTTANSKVPRRVSGGTIPAITPTSQPQTHTTTMEEKKEETPTVTSTAQVSDPHDTTPSWLKKATATTTSTSTTAPVTHVEPTKPVTTKPATKPTVVESKPPPPAAADFDVDDFLGLNKKTTTSSSASSGGSTFLTEPVESDPYATKPKNKSDAPHTTTNTHTTTVPSTTTTTAVKKETVVDTTPAWLKGSSTTTTTEEKAASSSNDTTPAWLKSSTSNSSATSPTAATTTAPVEPSKPAVEPAKPTAPVPTVEIGGRRARGPAAVAATTAVTKPSEPVKPVEQPKPVPVAAVVDDTPSWLKTSDTKKESDVPSWLASSSTSTSAASKKEEKASEPDWMKPTTTTTTTKHDEPKKPITTRVPSATKPKPVAAPAADDESYDDEFDLPAEDF